MKLKPESVAYILNAVKTAKLVGIDNIIIEPDLLRAIDDNNTVVLFQNENVPQMEFGSIGLNRIDVLTARHDIASSQDGFSIEAVVNDKDDYAKALTFKAKGIKVDYRCANPQTIKAPRQVNDQMKYEVQLNTEAVNVLQKGSVAMGADTMSIISNNGVSFELSDINNDVFKHTFTEKVKTLDGSDDTSFAHRYSVKTLLALFKQNPENTFQIGQKGILRFTLNGLTIFVLPRV